MNFITLKRQLAKLQNAPGKTVGGYRIGAGMKGALEGIHSLAGRSGEPPSCSASAGLENGGFATLLAAIDAQAIEISDTPLACGNITPPKANSDS